jgi:hypothetical protein
MGEPTSGEPEVSHTQSIGMGSETGRTETSKYPEEKKETSIPQVAASEPGRAQTIYDNRPLPFHIWGCGVPSPITERAMQARGKQNTAGKRGHR